MDIKPYAVGTKVKVSTSYFIRKALMIPKDCCGIITNWKISDGNDPLCQIQTTTYTVQLKDYYLPNQIYLHDVRGNEIGVINEPKSGDTDGDYISKFNIKDCINHRPYSKPNLASMNPGWLCDLYTSIDKLKKNALIINKSDLEQILSKEELNKMLDKANKNVAIPEIDRVIFSDPATIILWKAYHYETIPDAQIGQNKVIKVQDKTVVKCAPGETFSKYNGFCAAVTKYIFGTNSNIARIVKNAMDDSPVKEKDIKKVTKEKQTPCKYHEDKCGRKYTCKSVYDCNGLEDKTCKEYLKNEKKKTGGKGKK